MAIGDRIGRCAAVSMAAQLGYAGEYTDAESGLIYLRARYYDPATGQFLSRDPLAALTQSPYGYVDGDPLNGSDPSGLCGWISNAPCPGANLLDRALHTGVGKGATSVLVGIGDGATFGATATIREAISSGSSCTFDHNGFYYGGMGFGAVGGMIATGGVAADAADGAIAFGPGTEKAWVTAKAHRCRGTRVARSSRTWRVAFRAPTARGIRSAIASGT